jgi:AraC-like DNA-binding protein
MSPTQMKKYFKLAYGDSIYSYLKTYRMKKATQLLLDGKFNVAEVASRVGYTNSSKFAQAFKEYTGCSPKEYKNKT